MREIKRRSTAPYYVVMGFWVLWALLFPLYKVIHLVLALVLTFVVYKLARILFPDQTVLIKEPEKPQTTGNPQLDALIAQKDAALREMQQLDEAIADEGVSQSIHTIRELTGKITAEVLRKPEKLGQIKPFMSYYLPTTLKLLRAYAQMDAAGVNGQNISATKKKVEGMLQTIVSAFTHQLDALFGAEALDISTDITVLENMMAREGLTDGAAAAAPKPGPDIELKL